MDERRLDGLLTYLSELQRLQNSGYTCLREIGECIGWVRDEFTKEPSEPQDIVEFRGFTGFIDKGRNGND